MRSGSGPFAAAVAALLLLAAPAAAQRPAGAADLETSASFVLRGLEDTDVVTALGDVDGDGRRDAAVAADDGDSVRVLLSGEGGPGTRGFRIAGTDVEDLVTPEDAGDVNGDGLADIVVPTSSARYDHDDYDENGRAVVVLGRRAPQDVDLRRPEQRDLTIELPGDEGGVAGAGDVNGDGLGDLIVGRGFDGFEADDEGRDEDERPTAAVVFGTREARATRDVRRLGAAGYEIEGSRTDLLFGLTVASAGDVDGDGLGDVVIGSPITVPEDIEDLSDEEVDADVLAELQRGRAYVVYGRREGTAIDVARPGAATRLDTRRGTSLGFAAVAARDVNGDGLGDVAVSAPGFSLLLPTGQETKGHAYVVFGARARPAAIDVDALGDRGFVVEGRRGTAGTGLSLAAAGDQDRDGRADLVVGELGQDSLSLFALDDAQVAGAAQLVYGSASGATVDLANPGDRALALRGSGGDTAGASVAAGSDLDRDGRAEILIARPGACRVGRLAEGDAVGFTVGAPPASGAGRGTARDDVLTGGPVGESLFGFAGSDLLQGRDGHDCVFGGDGPDRLRGGLTGDVLFGELDADDLRGDSGCDRIFGGEGPDRIIAGPARVSVAVAMREPIGARDRDDVRGGGGDDRISGGLDSDELGGDAGDDRIEGGTSGDRLVGGDGRDALLGGAGNDDLQGGTEDDGDDFFEVEELLDLPQPPSDADSLDGGSGRDSLSGGPGADRLRGGSGRDLLFGGDGRDILRGGTGADRLDGEAGSDAVLAGTGDDRVDSVDRNADVVRCGAGRDVARVDQRDRVVGCERVMRVRRQRGRARSERAPLARRTAEALARTASSFGRR